MAHPSTPPQANSYAPSIPKETVVVRPGSAATRRSHVPLELGSVGPIDAGLSVQLSERAQQFQLALEAQALDATLVVADPTGAGLQPLPTPVAAVPTDNPPASRFFIPKVFNPWSEEQLQTIGVVPPPVPVDTNRLLWGGPGIPPQIPPQVQLQEQALTVQMPAPLRPMAPLPNSPLPPLQSQSHSIITVVAGWADEVDHHWKRGDLCALQETLHRSALALWHRVKDQATCDAALRAMACKGEIVCAHLMGACHHFWANLDGNDPLRRLLRRQRTGVQGVHASLVQHHTANFGDSNKRAEAIKALVVHLSWLAPAWYPCDSIGHLPHHTSLRGALDLLLNALNARYPLLESASIRQAFLDDVLAAFAPACCSPLLATCMASSQCMPQWLETPLFAVLARAAVADSNPLFPAQTLVRELCFDELESRVPRASQEVSWVVAWVVLEAATKTEMLLLQPDLARLKTLLERLMQRMSVRGDDGRLSHVHDVALKVLALCKPVPAAFIMGALQGLDKITAPESPWMRGLCMAHRGCRIDPGTVIDHWLPLLLTRATCADGLKAMLVQLSWIGPRVSGSADTSSVRALVTRLTVARSAPDARDFLRDFAAALMPAYCSLWLVDSLLAIVGLPSWLSVQLQDSRARLAQGPGRGLYPDGELWSIDLTPVPANTVSDSVRFQGGVQLAQVSRPVSVPIERVPTLLVGSPEYVAVSNATRTMRDGLEGNEPVKARDALKALAQRAIHPASDDIPSRLRVFLDAIDALMDPVDRAHLRGAFHYFHDHNLSSSALLRWLRFNPPPGAITLQLVVHRTMEERFGDPSIYARALAATLVQLSWMALSSHPHSSWARLCDTQLVLALRTLMGKLNDTHIELSKTSTQHLLVAAVQSAVAPAYCSPWLATKLRGLADKPAWLNGPLGGALDLIAADIGGAFFPTPGGWEKPAPTPAHEVTKTKRKQRQKQKTAKPPVHLASAVLPPVVPSASLQFGVVSATQPRAFESGLDIWGSPDLGAFSSHVAAWLTNGSTAIQAHGAVLGEMGEVEEFQEVEEEDRRAKRRRLQTPAAVEPLQTAPQAPAQPMPDEALPLSPSQSRLDWLDSLFDQ